MIGKIPKPGKSFKGCVLYNMEKHHAVVLDAEGVRMDSAEHAIRDFNLQRKMNPALGQAVGHIALSWSPNDRHKLTPELMVAIAKEYLEHMEIRNTQYLITEHRDRPHPHVHIVYNRVGNDGSTISDRFQKRRNVKACKELTLKYGFYMAKDKSQVIRQRLTGADKVKYELYDAISRAVKQARSWEDLEARLQKQDITIQFKYKGQTNEVQGISFAKGKAKFKGSELDRSLSYGKLSQQIGQSKQVRQRQLVGLTIAKPTQLSPRPSFVHAPPKQIIGILKTLLEPVPDYQVPDPLQPARKKKKKRKLRIT